MTRSGYSTEDPARLRYFLAEPFRFTATGVSAVTDGSRIVSQDVGEITVTLR